MKATFYAAETNGYDMFISVHEDGTIIYATDGEIDADLHSEFETVEKAMAWLNTVEDDSAFTVFDGDPEEFWNGINIIAKLETIDNSWDECSEDDDEDCSPEM